MSLTVRSYSPEILEAWRAGVDEFNGQRYWHAHERWEQGWTGLPEPDRTHVQALIQACGAFHLFGIGRTRPALALCASALEKFASVEREMAEILPRLEIAGLIDALNAVVADPDDWVSHATKLRSTCLSP